MKILIKDDQRLFDFQRDPVRGRLVSVRFLNKDITPYVLEVDFLIKSQSKYYNKSELRIPSGFWEVRFKKNIPNKIKSLIDQTVLLENINE